MVNLYGEAARRGAVYMQSVQNSFVHWSNTTAKRCTTVRSRCFSRVDSDSLNFDLSRADWSAVFTTATVTLKWNAFVAIFLPIIDSHAPHRSVRIRNPSDPVVSDSTKALMSLRRAALASFGHGSDQYRDANRAVRSAIRQDTYSPGCWAAHSRGRPAVDVATDPAYRRQQTSCP